MPQSLLISGKDHISFEKLMAVGISLFLDRIRKDTYPLSTGSGLSYTFLATLFFL